MKILYWTETFWPDISGVAVLGMQHCAALKLRGHEIIIVCSHGAFKLPDLMEQEGIQIYRFHFQSALIDKNLKDIKELKGSVSQLVDSFEPDILHINSSEPSIFFLQHIIRSQSIQILATVHFILSKRYTENTLYGRTLRLTDWVVGVSDSIMKDAVSINPKIKNRTSVIPNCLKMPTSKPTDLPFDPPILLCLGRLDHDKGFDIAITGFAKVLEIYPDAKMVIAGEGPDKIEIETCVQKLKLDQSIEFIGRVEIEDIPDLINRVTIVIIPSRSRESFGLVALQAAQFARPVIASNVGGLPEIVLHNKTGLLTEPENSKSIENAILKLLADIDNTKKIGSSAYLRTIKEFSISEYIDKYETIYNRLNKQHRKENE